MIRAAVFSSSGGILLVPPGLRGRKRIKIGPVGIGKYRTRIIAMRYPIKIPDYMEHENV